ncbi:hypothetical protein AA313_de0202050 [Arthrobotrys entomopaga]|nr:hypothetical protein AA313_de0202050 [Arthrobotrys entomopaga]
MKQQPYDRRPSSVDTTNWYSAGSSFSGTSVSGAPTGASPMNLAPGGATTVVGGAGGGVNRRTSVVSSLVGSGGMATEDEEDRGEVSYTPARMSIVAGGGPSEACGGGHDPMQNRSQSESATYGYNHTRNSFQLTLIEKLYGYNQVNNGTISPRAKPQEISSMIPRGVRNTSVYRSFEGWGFNADEIHRMDPIEERGNDELPEVYKPFRFDASISRGAYAAKDPDMLMLDVDPLDPMDSTSRSYIESHPLPIPVKVSRKRSSQQYTRDFRKRRGSSLQSAQGQQPRPHHGRLHSNAKSAISNGSVSSSPYRPSIVLSEVPMFELSESEPPTRNVSVTDASNRGSMFEKRGSVRGGGSISNRGTRRSRRLSKKSKNSSSRSSLVANNGSYEIPEGKKSFFSFLSRRKSKTKPGAVEPTSEPRPRERRGSVDSNNFVPLLQDIAEVSSVSSRGHTPELLTATEAPIVWIRAPQPLRPSIVLQGKQGILPVEQSEYNARRASIALQMDDDDVFDNPPPVVPHRERRRSSSSVFSQNEILAMKAIRKASSIYEEDVHMAERYRRSSSVYDRNGSMQPGEEESPSESASPEWIYSESHMSHPEVYVPPRANWYKSEWGLNETDAQEAEAVRVIVSKSRRGSVDEESIRMASASAGRKRSCGGDKKMADLSNALRDALKMNDILEEDYYI